MADPVSRRPDYAVQERLTPIGQGFGAMTRRSAGASESAAPSETQGACIRAPDYLAELADMVQEGYKCDAWFHSESNLKSLHQAHGFWWKDARLVIPEHADLRAKLLEAHHDTPYSGHVGVNRTENLVARQYWWPHMRADVIAYVTQCAVCQRNKPTNTRPAGLLQPLQVPERPWISVSMDLITGLPQTRSGHTAIAVFVDRMSKMAHFVATQTTVGAAGMARLFLDNIFKLHGMPEDIVSDRDPRFTSIFWSELMAMLGAKRSMSTAYHPQSDGQTERMNRVLEDMLRHYCDPSQADWDEHLSLAEFAVNNAVQASTKFTPFMLNSGQHPRTPATIADLRDAYPSGRRKNPAAEQKFVEMQKRLKAARENLYGAQQRQKSYADEVRRTHSFTVGQRVLLSTVHIARRSPGTAKLLPKWIGPFTISVMI